MFTLLQLEFKRIRNDIINRVFVILIILSTGLGLWLESITVFHAYTFLHQLAIFWAVFSGYRFGASQKVSGAEEWIRLCKKEEARIWTQTFALDLDFLFCVLCMMGMTTLAYFWSDHPVHILGQSLIALLLYYFLPMCIGGNIGWALGRKVPLVQGYLLAAVIGFFLGSLGAPWIVAVGQLLSVDLPLAPDFGLPGAHKMFNALQGFDLSMGQWSKRLFWLAVSLIPICGFVKSQKKKAILLSALGVVLVSTGITTMQRPISYTVGQGDLVLTPVKKDNEFYYDREEIPYESPRFQWEEMNIKLNTETKSKKGTGSGHTGIWKRSTWAARTQRSWKDDPVSLCFGTHPRDRKTENCGWPKGYRLSSATLSDDGRIDSGRSCRIRDLT